MTNANTTEDTTKHGRRATDNKSDEGVFSHPSRGLWSVIRNSVGVAFVLTICVGVGRFSHTVDTNVKEIDVSKQERKEIMLAIKEITLTLKVDNSLQKERDKQQKESDIRFEGKFDKSNSIQEKVLDKLNEHDRQIIIMQQKISVKDKTMIDHLAMR